MGEIISLSFWYLNNFQCLNCLPICFSPTHLRYHKWHPNPATLHSRSFHPLHFHLISPPLSWFLALPLTSCFTCFGSINDFIRPNFGFLHWSHSFLKEKSRKWAQVLFHSTNTFLSLIIS